MRTGICKHCGKKKKEHYVLPCVDTPKTGGNYCYSYSNTKSFEDSGLARLHEHAEELYEAAVKVIEEQKFIHPYFFLGQTLKELESILQKIKP